MNNPGGPLVTCTNCQTRTYDFHGDAQLCPSCHIDDLETQLDALRAENLTEPHPLTAEQRELAVMRAYVNDINRANEVCLQRLRDLELLHGAGVGKPTGIFEPKENTAHD